MGKIDKLIGYIERWISERPRRSLNLLARLSGVAYPTLRRIAQKESQPTIENALYILNFVATLQETLDYFSDNPSIQAFYGKVTQGKEVLRDTDSLERYLKKEAWWILALALTVGATEENVRSLLGSHGIAELNSLVDEKLIYEERPGLYRSLGTSIANHVESLKFGSTVARHIADLPTKPDSYSRFLCYNVTQEKFRDLKALARDFFLKLDADAQTAPGDEVFAASIVLTRVLDDEGEKL